MVRASGLPGTLTIAAEVAAGVGFGGRSDVVAFAVEDDEQAFLASVGYDVA